MHDGAQFLLCVDFGAAVDPLEQRSERRTLLVSDGVCHEPHIQAADLYLGAMIACCVREQVAISTGVFVKLVEVRALHADGRETGQIFPELGFGVTHQGFAGLVLVTDDGPRVSAIMMQADALSRAALICALNWAALAASSSIRIFRLCSGDFCLSPDAMLEICVNILDHAIDKLHLNVDMRLDHLIQVLRHVAIGAREFLRVDRMAYAAFLVVRASHFHLRFDEAVERRDHDTHGVGHAPEFVGSLVRWESDFKVALGELAHCARHACERF